MQRTVQALTVLVIAASHATSAEPPADFAKNTEMVGAKPEGPEAAYAVKAFASGELGTRIVLGDDGTVRSLYISPHDYSPHVLEYLHGLTNLEYLSLNGPQITDEVLLHLARLHHLNRLNLGSARFSDGGFSTNVTGAGLRHLKTLKQLRDLRIATRRRVDDEGLSHLAGLTDLEWLYVENDCAPILEHRRPNQNRKPATILDSNITDQGLVHLKEMTKMEMLLLGNTDIRGPGLVHLAGMRNLKKLYLHGSPVTDAGVAHLATFKKLEWMGLGGTKVTDEGVKKLQLLLPGCEVDR